MTATRRVLHPNLFRLLVAAALAVGLTVPLSAISHQSAQAAVPAAVGMQAVKMAATRKGTPTSTGPLVPAPSTAPA